MKIIKIIVNRDDGWHKTYKYTDDLYFFRYNSKNNPDKFSNILLGNSLKICLAHVIKRCTKLSPQQIDQACVNVLKKVTLTKPNAYGQIVHGPIYFKGGHIIILETAAVI